MHKKAVAVGVALISLGIASAPVWALQAPWIFISDPLIDPWILMYEDTDYLVGSGDYWTYTGTLDGGVTYKFVLIVPYGADFDIKIYDADGNLVASGILAGSEDEVVYLTPLWTQTFTIVVYSFSGRGFYTLQVYY